MSRPVRSWCAALLVAIATVAEASGAADGRASAVEGGSFGVAFERPEVGLARVLNRGQLVVRYSCMHECGPVMKLRVGGIEISTFDPPGGPTAGIRAAVFALDRDARRALAASTRHGAASFRLSAVFTDRSGDRLTRVLRFRLRR